MKTPLATTLTTTILLVGLLAGCRHDSERVAAEMTGGDPARGLRAIEKYGCASCHQIPGARGANARVGPPLDGMRRRVYLAGRLLNTPENLMRWIQHPQEVERGNAMPDMGVTDEDARDITAWLYTLE